MLKNILLFLSLIVQVNTQKCFVSSDIVNSDKLFTYKDNVYDITNYNHPGGQNTLKRTVGGRLEDYVNLPAYDFHLTSNSFKKDLEDMLVGILRDTCDASSNTTTSSTTSSTTPLTTPTTTPPSTISTTTSSTIPTTIPSSTTPSSTQTTTPTTTPTSTTSFPCLCCNTTTTQVPVTTSTIPTIIPINNCTTLLKYNSSISYEKQNIIAETNKININQDINYLNLTMTQINGKGIGSRISTTNYFRYGRIDVTLKVSKGVNVINGFYIEADNGDMVVFNIIQNIENKNSIIETNFFYKGNLLYDINAQYFTSDIILYDTFNTYSIVWYPTYYEWRLNNILLRTVTIDDTDSYPDSPSKIKLSIWEGPVSTWAGPGIKWDKTSFYTSTLSSLKITNNCLTNYSYIENVNKTSENTQHSLSSKSFVNVYILLCVLNLISFSLL